MNDFLFNRKTFKDKHNQAILSRLVREVKSLNSTFLTEYIKGMHTRINTITYYESYAAAKTIIY